MGLRPKTGKCAYCGKEFPFKNRKQGGGPRQKFCSAQCRAKIIRESVVVEFEKTEDNTSQRIERSRVRKYNWTVKEFENELQRQSYSCYGCLSRIDKKVARIDHDHKTNKIRGLLCDHCNRLLGMAKENPGTLRRLMAYLDHDREKINIYLAGSLKNQRVIEIGNNLRALGYDVMDEWITPGEFADENWQKYEKQRGRTYREALRGRAATNIFLFDRSYLDLSDIVIVVLPAGKSAMLELGYAKGHNKKAWILLDGNDPERYDIMPGFADKIFKTEEELKEYLLNQDNFLT